MANLKAAVSRGADAVYLGMQKFTARQFATNFNEEYLKEAIRICKSNNVKVDLTMNTLVKNDEIKDFFRQLSFAYSSGIDAVIIQEISFVESIKKNFPDLKVHISTQAGVMNSCHVNLVLNADRINLARELSKEEIKEIRKHYQGELEIFCHGALCVSVSGSCIFSSFLGGRSGNRGKCAQPCRKKYNGEYYLSTKELCLIKKIPEIIGLGIDSVKVEGRMRTPYYVATVTETYRKAIDDFYEGNFNITPEMMNDLEGAFYRGFTEGKFDSLDIFNREKATGESNILTKETYEVKIKDVKIDREKIRVLLPDVKRDIEKPKKLMVRVYSYQDAISAANNGADIVYYDLFAEDLSQVKKEIKCKLFGVTPRIMLDKDIGLIKKNIRELKPDGILAGNLGSLNLGLRMPIHLDYNVNCFNDHDLEYFSLKKSLPIISPELSLWEMAAFRNRNFIAFVHGKIRLMTLRHELSEGIIKDEKGGKFIVNPIFNGSEIINEKELGLLGKSSQLVNSGINNFFIDTDKKVSEITKFYRRVLDGKKVDDVKLKKNYVLGWSFRGVS
ncbi:MAG: U32 family peptidase [Methanocellales archaeon]|nr:U32 family peptidase [Methanocellales archaeon]